MAKKQINIVIDTMQAQYSTIGTFKQLDSVFFNVQITEQGIAKDLTGQTLKLYINKADKKVVEQKTGIEIISATEGKITIDLLNAALQAEGFAVAELNISDAAGSISTVNFNFRVAPTVANDNFIESSNEISTLKEVEVYVAQAKKEIQDFKKLQGEMSTLNNSMKADEQTRKTSENTRVTNENTRKTNETSRVTKENERIANETTRSTNETTRVQSENLRKTAEATRVSNENLRKTNEASRTTAETARLEAEKTRVASEATRNENEETRKTNETDRVEAEKVREQRFEEMESSSTLFDITKEITDARTGYFGKEHASLQDRLNDEFQFVTVDNSRGMYVEQSTDTGHMKIENSIEGRARDTVVKGRTLQNLIEPIKDKVSESEQYTIENNVVKINRTNASGTHTQPTFPNTIHMLKPNTLYTIIAKISNNTITGGQFAIFNNYALDPFESLVLVPNNFNGLFVQTVKTKQDLSKASRIAMICPRETLGTINIEDVILLENDHTANPPTTYHEGIKSLGEDDNNRISILSTGKNLFDWRTILTGELTDGYFINKNKPFSIRFNVPNPNLQYTVVASGLADSFGSDANFMKSFAINVFYTDGSHTQKYIDGNNVVLNSTLGETIKDIEITHPFATSRPDYTARIKDIALYEGIVNLAKYQPYQSDKKDILIPVSGGAKGFENGVSDESYDNGDYLQKIGIMTLDENNIFPKGVDSNGEACHFYGMELPLEYTNYKLNSKFMCNKLQQDNAIWGPYNKAGIRIRSLTECHICILKTDLESYDIQGLKKLLAKWKAEGNPLTIYYELTEPILHKAQTPVNHNFATFKEITHISCLNKIAPSNMSAKFPVDLPATISRLTSENKELLNENIELQNKANALTLENEMQQLDIDINMLATIDLFEMMVGTARSVKGGDRMVEVYVSMIIKGKKKLEDVPAIIRPQVEQMLIDLGIIA